MAPEPLFGCFRCTQRVRRFVASGRISPKLGSPNTTTGRYARQLPPARAGRALAARDRVPQQRSGARGSRTGAAPAIRDAWPLLERLGRPGASALLRLPPSGLRGRHAALLRPGVGSPESSSARSQTLVVLLVRSAHQRTPEKCGPTRKRSSETV